MIDIIQAMANALEEEYPPQEPYVDDLGIWMPEGRLRKLVMSREVFVEAYRRFIKEGE